MGGQLNVSQAAARVYARALFDIGMQTGTVGSIYDDLHAVNNALRGLDTELQTYFSMPQLRRVDKHRVIDAAFADKVGRTVLGLLHVLVEKRRESLFDNVVEEFDQYRDQHEGVVQATVVTARKLDQDLADALRAALAERTGREVVLTEQIDPEVLGGIRVNVGDSVLDGTLRRGLQDMRRSLAASQGRG